MAEGVQTHRVTVWKGGKPTYLNGLPDTEEITAYDARDVEPLLGALKRSAEALHGLSDDPVHLGHVFAECPNGYCYDARKVLRRFQKGESDDG